MNKETINYDNYIKYRVEKGQESSMTRLQSLLAQEIFTHDTLLDIMSQPGDMQTIFVSIQKYLKGR